MLNQTQAVNVFAGGMAAEYSANEFVEREDFSDPVWRESWNPEYNYLKLKCVKSVTYLPYYGLMIIAKLILNTQQI